MIWSWRMVTLPLFFCLVVVDGLKAEPRVLHDTGRTIPIDPYMAPFKPKPQAAGQRPPAPALSLESYGLPIKTPSMAPGRVHPRTLPALQGKMAGAQPLFLLGADRWSLEWLQQNQARLTELHAVGMVVSVASAYELSILRQAAGPLQLMPASGEAIARELGLTHYPVLISPPGVIDQ